MGIVTLPSFGSDPATVTAALLDGKVDPLNTEFNGNIENVNIKASAAIAYSKLNLTGQLLNADVNTSAAIAASKLDLSPVAQTIEMSGKSIEEAKGANIASASTTTIWATDGNFMHITGTTTITSFGTASQAGISRTIVFDDALTLTHNATSLICPTGANITTAAGDTAFVRAETTANARVIAYYRKDGSALVGFTASNAPAGTVLQCVNVLNGAVTSCTTTLPYDDTIPQITEGTEVMTLAIAPNSATNNLKITVVAHAGSDDSVQFGAALFQGATAGALTCAYGYTGSTHPNPLTMIYFMTAGTTSSTTFRTRVGAHSGNATFNGATTRKGGGVLYSSMTIEEIKV